MKFSVALPGNHRIPTPPDWVMQLKAPQYQQIAAAVDELGYHTITTSEHFVMPNFEVPRLGPYWTHALTVMAFVAGATRRVRVDTTVLVMPYHHPVELAKAIATLDVLSGGRATLSVGVGHAVKEFEILGIPFNKRGKMTDEALEVVKLCWSDSAPEFKGEFFHIDGVACEPGPVQDPRPPIYIGGNSEAALRRAARHDGWHPNPVGFSVTDIVGPLSYIRSQPEYAGKEDTFEVYFGLGGVGSAGMGFGDFASFAPFGTLSGEQLSTLRGRLLDAIGVFAEHGVTITSVPLLPTRSVEEYLDCLRWISSDVIAAV